MGFGFRAATEKILGPPDASVGVCGVNGRSAHGPIPDSCTAAKCDLLTSRRLWKPNRVRAGALQRATFARSADAARSGLNCSGWRATWALRDIRQSALMRLKRELRLNMHA